jgi:hypothetical protein
MSFFFVMRARSAAVAGTTACPFAARDLALAERATGRRRRDFALEVRVFGGTTARDICGLLGSNRVFSPRLRI